MSKPEIYGGKINRGWPSQEICSGDGPRSLQSMSKPEIYGGKINRGWPSQEICSGDGPRSLGHPCDRKNNGQRGALA